MILGIPDVKDLPPGTGLRTESFLSAFVAAAVGKEPEACKTEESLKGERREIEGLGKL